MSDLIAKPQISDSKDCPAAARHPMKQRIITRTAQIGDNLTIRRALPHPDRRMIGAWCFFDHFGPLNLKTGELDIAPHPHMGLQTFTWTLQGEILHRDSLGSEQIIKPGQVNLMNAGQGIAHSEQSLPDSILHGVQLWIALPDKVRNMPADFMHYAHVPQLDQDGLHIYVLAGEFSGTQSPCKVYSPLMGLSVEAKQAANTTLKLNPKFEYGILPLTDNIEAAGEAIDINTLLYLGCGHHELSLKMPKGAHALIIGGEPFVEEILMWWNFVARTETELLEAVLAWDQHTRFGEVHGYQGGRLSAPPIHIEEHPH